MNFNIRKAAKEDIPVISELIDKLCKLEFENYDETIVPNYTQTDNGQKFIEDRIMDGKDSFAIIATLDNKTIGYFIGGIILPEDYRKQIKVGVGETMFIEEEYRGQGIGFQFISMFEDWCKKEGVRRTRLVASSKNTKGIKLYKRLGYEEYDITLEKDL